MDTLGRDRWHKPFKPFEAKNDRELKLALVLYGHIRRRNGIPTRFLGALTGLKQRHSRVLGPMHAGKLIGYHDSVKDHHNANYRDIEWMPTKKGDQWYDRNIKKLPDLTYEPRRGLNSWYAHASGCSIIGASFDVAARDYDLELGYYATDMQVYDGLEPDEPPFWLKAARQIDITGWEYDRGTMSLEEFGRKLEKWNLYYINRHYERHGMRAPYTPIIDNGTHPEKLRDKVREKIHPRLHDRFPFKTIPDFKDHELPPATGFIVSEPWQRTDGSKFNMLEEIGWTSRNSKTSSASERLSTETSGSL